MTVPTRNVQATSRVVDLLREPHEASPLPIFTTASVRGSPCRESRLQPERALGRPGAVSASVEAEPKLCGTPPLSASSGGRERERERNPEKERLEGRGRARTARLFPASRQSSAFFLWPRC